MRRWHPPPRWMPEAFNAPHESGREPVQANTFATVRAPVLSIRHPIHRIVLLVGCLLSSSGHALEILQRDSRQQQSRYYLELEAQLRADTEAVRATLQDPRSLARLSALVNRVAIVERRGPDHLVIEQEAEGCVLFFCRSLEQRYDMVMYGERILVTNRRGQGDFRYAIHRWHVTETAEPGTRVRLRAELEPDFWVPPGIGTYLIRKRFERETVKTLERLESDVGTTGDD